MGKVKIYRPNGTVVDEEALRKLLLEAGCVIEEGLENELLEECVAPDEIDIEILLLLLQSETGDDEDTAMAVSSAVAAGAKVIGLWVDDTGSENHHMAIEKLGSGQIAWDAEALKLAICGSEGVFQSPSGGSVTSLHTPTNPC